jgi:hypothetical protein
MVQALVVDHFRSLAEREDEVLIQEPTICSMTCGICRWNNISLLVQLNNPVGASNGLVHV